MEAILLKPSGDVVLHLIGKAYKEYRTIGKISNFVFYTFRSNSKNQKYHFHNSFGFCYKLITDHSDKFKLICVNFNGLELWSSVRAMFKHGRISHLKKNDLELQIHLSVPLFHYTREAAIEEMNELQDIINKEIAMVRGLKPKTNEVKELSLFDI